MKGSDIKEYIRREGYTQMEIARRLGISPQALRSRLNVASISLATIDMIAKAMNRPVESLLGSPYDEETMLRRELERLRKIIAEQETELKVLKEKIKD
jgi:transcriptional regulator with XRE-family HTH domain